MVCRLFAFEILSVLLQKGPIMSVEPRLEAVEQEQPQKPQQPSPPIVEPVALNDVIDLPLSGIFERNRLNPFKYRIATVETEFVRYNYQYYPAVDWVILFAIAAFAAVPFASKLSLLHFLYNAAQTVLAGGALVM